MLTAATLIALAVHSTEATHTGTSHQLGCVGLTEAECAKVLCQCVPETDVDPVTDGLYFAASSSNAASVLAGRDAVSNDGSYSFAGCGAHSSYITPADDGSGVDEVGFTAEGYPPYSDQIGGYPFRWCFTVGGTTCLSSGVSKKNVLDQLTAWKTCSGHYGCNAKFTGPVVTEASTQMISQQVIGDDWSECCKLCSETSSCKQWSYAVLEQRCHLYSAVAHAPARVSSAAAHFTGTPGHDDPPMSCQERNDYDTCTVGPKCPVEAAVPDEHSAAWCTDEHRCFVEVWTFWTSHLELHCVSTSELDLCASAACDGSWRTRTVFNLWLLLGIISIFALCWCGMCSRNKRKLRTWRTRHHETVLSDSITVTKKTSTRTRSTKHGTERYTVTVFTSIIEYTYLGQTRTFTCCRDGRAFLDIATSSKHRNEFAHAELDGVVALAVRNSEDETPVGFCCERFLGCCGISGDYFDALRKAQTGQVSERDCQRASATQVAADRATNANPVPPHTSTTLCV